MKLIVVAIRDYVQDEFLNLWTAPNIGSAIRAFSLAVKEGDTPMSKSPKDFELFQLGTWDKETGELTSEKQILLAQATDYATPAS